MLTLRVGGKAAKQQQQLHFRFLQPNNGGALAALTTGRGGEGGYQKFQSFFAYNRKLAVLCECSASVLKKNK